MSVVVLNELSKHRFEVTPIDDQHPIQALLSDGADEPLGEGVGPRSTNRGTDD
jgi:hypothetical protein